MSMCRVPAIASVVTVLAVRLLAAADENKAVDWPFDTNGLADDPDAAVTVLLKKTIFQIDVLQMTFRIGAGTWTALKQQRDQDSLNEAAIADALLAMPHGAVRLRFLRRVSLDRFADSVTANVESAFRNGMIDAAERDRVATNIRGWFDFLKRRGLQPDDEVFYRIRPDGLQTVFRAANGDILLDRRDAGRRPPRTLRAGYLAPGSDFREPILAALNSALACHGARPRQQGPDSHMHACLQCPAGTH